MQIEYWFLIIGFLTIIVASVFIRLCYIQDKKAIDAEANKNKTVTFIEHNNALQWKDLDFQCSQQPAIDMPEGSN